MITLSKSGNSVTFTFDENSGYLQNGTIDVPINSLSLIIDESDMATFRKSASNDIFISARYEEFGMTKAELEAWYKANMVDTITEEEIQNMIDVSTADYFDGAEYDSGTTRINFYHNNTVKASIDASQFVIDGMIDDVRIETISGVTYLVIDFNTASGKEDIQIPLTDIFDPSNYYTKQEVDASLSGKQDTLSAGTNITIVDNVISAEGGGKAVSGGTNISITTGETADTINCTLPISATSQGIYTSSSPFRSTAPKQGNVIFGSTNFLEVFGNSNRGNYNTIFGNDNHINPSTSASYNFIGGNHNSIFNKPVSYATIFGYYNKANNGYETSLGIYNNSVNVSSTFGNSGNTLFSVGNGTADNARHNAFEIRQNGDIYLTKDGQDVKLQDQLGGGEVSSAITSGDTNAVAGGAVYDKFDEVEQVTAAALNNINDRLSEDEEVTAAGLNAVNSALGGLKLQQITQSAYDALVTKDASTLYIIVN